MTYINLYHYGEDDWQKIQICGKISNISCTKSQNLNDAHLVLQLTLPNPLKPDVKLRMKM